MDRSSRLYEDYQPMPKDNEVDIDWKRVLGFLLMIVGAVGSAGALIYIWFMQMMLRYARHSLWDGVWFFVVCGTALGISILAVYVGYKMYKAARN
jgi:hypothetical protein